MSGPRRRQFATRDPDACVGFITDLVVRCGRGEEAALLRLFDLFHRAVSEAIRAGSPAAPLDEQILRVFVGVWEHAPRFVPGEVGPVDWVMEQVGAAARTAPAIT